MKKLITLTMAMMLMLTACGAGAGAQEKAQNTKSKLFPTKSIEGTWVDDTEIKYPGEGMTITIDGDDVLVEDFNKSYVGYIDRSDSTLTIENAQRNSEFETVGDAVYTYQIIGDKLVLKADNDDTALGWTTTWSFTKQNAEGSEK